MRWAHIAMCMLGMHDWDQDRGVNLYDIFPNPMNDGWKPPKRQCRRCGKCERWLPGYGGSEIGCWIGDGR